ncbi:MAG: hypothetical protein LBG81_05510 [Coriobacteriaceae bacterium]|jgi:hypothetical protein|nr:hypothetical protein [Coriobacteriaceae bacterium]
MPPYGGICHDCLQPADDKPPAPVVTVTVLVPGLVPGLVLVFLFYLL